MVRVSRRSLRTVYYGWWAVLACSAVTLLTAGTFFYGFTALLKPVIAEFGWSRAVTSLAFSLRSLESGFAAPVVGFFVDRVGSRKLILFGVAVLGVGLLALSRIGSLWAFYGAFIIISIGISSCTSVPGMVVVANWFTTRRSAAMGLLMAGAGAGGLLVPVFSWLIDSYGWRTALVVSGIFVWAIGIPLSLAVKNKPDARRSSAPTPATTLQDTAVLLATSLAPLSNYKFGEAVRCRTFWLVSIAFTMSGAAIYAISVHLMPLAESVGFSVQTGALMVTVMTVSSIAGRLGFGWMGDLWDKRYVISLALGLEVVSLAAVAYVPRLGVLMVALAFFGAAYGGTVVLRPAIQADYFGIRAFGKIQGAMMAVLTISAVIGPVFMGWVFDWTGSYRLSLEVFAGAALLALPLIFALPQPACRQQRPM